MTCDTWYVTCDMWHVTDITSCRVQGIAFCVAGSGLGKQNGPGKLNGHCKMRKLIRARVAQIIFSGQGTNKNTLGWKVLLNKNKN